MKKKRIITIAGKPGSGKSTASKAVAEQLGFEHFSSGDLFRAIGRERGIDVYQTNLAAEKEKELDYLVDKRLQNIGAAQQDVAIDSRLAWHWIPESFKVFLQLNLETAAKRILDNIDPFRLKHEHIPKDSHKYAALLKKRLDSETQRYIKLYDANPYDMKNYNLVIDTSENGPEQVLKLIIEKYKMWLND